MVHDPTQIIPFEQNAIKNSKGILKFAISSCRVYTYSLHAVLLGNRIHQEVQSNIVQSHILHPYFKPTTQMKWLNLCQMTWPLMRVITRNQPPQLSKLLHFGGTCILVWTFCSKEILTSNSRARQLQFPSKCLLA